jgi:hypothetical protein
VPHKNIELSNFKIHNYSGVGVRVMGPKNSNISISDGYVYSDRGRDLVLDGQDDVKLENVTRGPWPTATTSIKRREK